MSPYYPLPFASIEDIAPFLVGTIFAMIPMVAILTKHQQKMAMILRNPDRSNQPTSRQPTEVESRILQELGALREIVAQQAIIIDDLATKRRELSASEADEAVRQRIGR